MLDIAILGSGPAALTAALYAARAGLKVTVFEKSLIGGVASVISDLENYPGFSGNGKDLVDKMVEQAKTAGAQIEYGECHRIERSEGNFLAHIDDNIIKARSIIIATGSSPKKLNIPGDDAKNIHYCASCDGVLYKDKTVLVIGGGNSALQEALFLSSLAKEVIVLARSTISATKVLQDAVQSRDNISIHEHITPQEFALQGNRFTVLKTLNKDFPADGAFIYVGNFPSTDFADQTITLDQSGFIQTDDNFQTSIPGIFAAGDCRASRYKQIIIAAGEGAFAALAAQQYLSTTK